MESIADFPTLFTATVLILGWLATRHYYRRSLRKLSAKLMAENGREWSKGFDAGWAAALREPTAVKKAYQYYFQKRP